MYAHVNMFKKNWGFTSAKNKINKIKLECIIEGQLSSLKLILEVELGLNSL